MVPEEDAAVGVAERLAGVVEVGDGCADQLSCGVTAGWWSGSGSCWIDARSCAWAAWAVGRETGGCWRRCGIAAGSTVLRGAETEGVGEAASAAIDNESEDDDYDDDDCSCARMILGHGVFSGLGGLAKRFKAEGTRRGPV